MKTNEERNEAILNGVIAGLAAGLFLTLMMTVMSAAGGKDIWYGIKGASAPFLGERAMGPGFDLGPVLLGLSLHFVISIGWAIPLALLTYRLGGAATLAAGVAWGLVVWIGMYFVVLPIAGLGAMTHDAPTGRAIMFHEFYSLAAALSLVVLQHQERRRFVHAHGL
jgi:hypothetical protein